MALQESGKLTAADIMAEFDHPANQTFKLSDDGASFINFDTGDKIAISDFYGASKSSGGGSYGQFTLYQADRSYDTTNLGKGYWIYGVNDPADFGEKNEKCSKSFYRKPYGTTRGLNDHPVVTADYTMTGGITQTPPNLGNRSRTGGYVWTSYLTASTSATKPNWPVAGKVPTGQSYKYEGFEYDHTGMIRNSSHRGTASDPNGSIALTVNSGGDSRYTNVPTTMIYKYGAGSTDEVKRGADLQLVTSGLCNGSYCYKSAAVQEFILNGEGYILGISGGSDNFGSSKLRMRAWKGRPSGDPEVSTTRSDDGHDSVHPHGTGFVEFFYSSYCKMGTWKPRGDGSWDITNKYSRHSMTDKFGVEFKGRIYQLVKFKGYYYAMGAFWTTSSSSSNGWGYYSDQHVVKRTTDPTLKSGWERIDIPAAHVAGAYTWLGDNDKGQRTRAFFSSDVLCMGVSKSGNADVGGNNGGGIVFTRNGTSWSFKRSPNVPYGSNTAAGAADGTGSFEKYCDPNAAGYTRADLEGFRAYSTTTNLSTNDVWYQANAGLKVVNHQPHLSGL